MAYTTVTEVRSRLPLVTGGVRTDAQLQDFIDQAAATVDTHLRGVYVLPLASPLDPLVRFIALDLACAATLENVFGEETPNDVGQPAALKRRALELLGAVHRGKIKLDHAAFAAPAAPALSRESLKKAAAETSVFGLGPDVLGESEKE